jgi:FkbM family methyltransferase
MANLRQRLERLLEKGGREVAPLSSDRIAIYGAGNCGRKVLRLAQQNGIAVAAFIDQRGGNREMPLGIPCVAPESAEARELAAFGVPVVIGIFNFTTNIAPIARSLARLGFKQVLTYPEYHERYGTDDDFWLTKRAFYADREADIIATYNQLDDERSRQVYYDCLAYRLNGDGNLLAAPDVANQYLPADLPAPASPMRLIDGGAFNGDTLRFFADRQRLEAIAAFEPDPTNYAALCVTAGELGERLRDAIMIPCGVGERTEMLSFHSGGGGGSAIAAAGTTNIQVVALDDILPTFAPTFLKLDVEGAEPAALRGAAQLIRRARPRLAVCVYHAPEHLWTLPRLICEINPSYRLALRYHQWNGFDVVAYAY